ncbi:toxin-antitoxin system YwqK family antitoxin [Aquimarina agarilytica]|uniref:toxin-antitoxin system YwqK family antitoxin n=1 Tax=Aquimarina agarilytica TaxID=1087449 RepID=UPI0002899FF2|nr:hypothetical protein [Aquimarina agarilytica]
MNDFKVIIFGFFLLLTNVFNAQINQYHSDGTRHGLWEKKYEGTEQLRYTGNFDHGVEIGDFKFYSKGFPKQPSAIKSFSDNGRKALVKYYAQNGKLISKGMLVNKKREGKWEYYHNTNAKLMMVENYVADLLEGERLSYYDNGRVSEKVTFIDGKKEGKEVVYTLKGVLYKVFTYKNGLLEGENKYYNGKGELVIEGVYKDNKKTGVWSYYENGKLVREKRYK